jgi:hypothetical protein
MNRNLLAAVGLIADLKGIFVRILAQAAHSFYRTYILEYIQNKAAVYGQHGFSWLGVRNFFGKLPICTFSM